MNDGESSVSIIQQTGSARMITRLIITSMMSIERHGYQDFAISAPANPGEFYVPKKHFMPYDVSMLKRNILRIQWLKRQQPVLLKLLPHVPPWHTQFDVKLLSSELEILIHNKPLDKYYLC